MAFNFGSTYQPQQSMFGVQNLDFNQPGMQMPGAVPTAGQPPAFNTGSTTGQNVMGGINAFSGLANAYMGYKNYGLARDQLDENRKQFDLNFNSQAGLVNNQLADQFALRQDSANANNRGMDFGTQAQYLEDRGVRGADGQVVGG